MTASVHVVAGFLGAGKTTLLRHLLGQLGPDERVGLVVNDFGEAAFDQQALAGTSTAAMREIRGSCLCCTAPEGFVGELTALLERGVDRVFVEPTGLARPADLIDTLRRAPLDVAVGPLVVVVDPGRIARGELSDEVLAQAAAADVLVANRIDRASAEELVSYRAWADDQWPPPHARLEVSHGEVPVDVLAWPEGTGPRAVAAPVASSSPPGHGYVARTFCWPSTERFHRRRLLAALAVGAERIKGVFRTDEGTVEIQQAGGDLTEVPSPRRSDSRVDVIVPEALAGRLSELEGALAGARLTDEERAASPSAVEVGLPSGEARTFDRAALRALPDQVPDVASLIEGRSGAAARVREILAASLPEDLPEPPGGLQVVVVAADGYVTPPVPLEALHEAVLVHSLGSGPLPSAKGGPYRLLIPGDAGPGGPCANVKGVVRIALRSSA